MDKITSFPLLLHCQIFEIEVKAWKNKRESHVWIEVEGFAWKCFNKRTYSIQSEFYGGKSYHQLQIFINEAVISELKSDNNQNRKAKQPGKKVQ